MRAAVDGASNDPALDCRTTPEGVALARRPRWHGEEEREQRRGREPDSTCVTDLSIWLTKENNPVGEVRLWPVVREACQRVCHQSADDPPTFSPLTVCPLHLSPTLHRYRHHRHSSSVPAILVARYSLAITAAVQLQHRQRCCSLFQQQSSYSTGSAAVHCFSTEGTGPRPTTTRHGRLSRLRRREHHPEAVHQHTAHMLHLLHH